MGSILRQIHVIEKDVKSCTNSCHFRCATIIIWLGGMPWTKTGANQYYAQLGLRDKGWILKWFVICNCWDLELLDLLNGLALGTLIYDSNIDEATKTFLKLCWIKLHEKKGMYLKDFLEKHSIRISTIKFITSWR